ncbi:MAG: DUF1295 domain-containing protein [Candidatus Thermoplasmatota archaeon]|nr:DUF1295 domain-containing protein [Candidatus Thermoplasmatota archaeon]
MLPIQIVAYLLLALWGTVVLMWLGLDRYWERKYMTEARRREKEAEKAQPRSGSLVNRAWSAVAITVILVLPILFIVDALIFPIGLLYAPSLSFFPPFASAWQVAGIVIALAGLWIMLTVGRTLARDVYGRAEAERSLITSGLYAHIRHPFYLTFTLIPLGLLLMTLNYLSLLLLFFYNTVDGPISPLTVMREEEEYLLERYGKEYEDHKQRTGRFLPRFWR